MGLPLSIRKHFRFRNIAVAFLLFATVVSVFYGPRVIRKLTFDVNQPSEYPTGSNDLHGNETLPNDN